MTATADQLLARFEGPDGTRRLAAAIKTQILVGGSDVIAEAFLGCGQLVAVQPGEVLIEEGAATNDIFFILAGSFSVHLGILEVAIRGGGTHVGEQALLDASQPRTTQVAAREPAVVFKVDEANFDRVANTYPTIWKDMARELSKRLIQRNRAARGTNEQVQVFIISASESLKIAEEVRVALTSSKVLCTLWTDGVFKAGTYALEALEHALEDKDFAIAVASPDDFQQTRGKDHVVPRDNVIFELGLFVGKIGRRRTILMESRDEDVKLPTDLTGLTTVPYRAGPADKLPALLGVPCQRIRRVIDELGPIT